MDADHPHVVVVGLGYIGLPTAAVIARSGAQVTGVDVSGHVVDTINAGGIHIEEANLDSLVRDMVDAGRLRASLAPAAGDAFVIAVPTPFDENRAPDIRHVLAAARSIAPVLRAGDLVIVESTCPVGTTDAVARLLGELRTDLTMPQGWDAPGDIAIAYCPERVLPGRILEELVANDRSIGGVSRACADQATRFYRGFVAGECIVTDARTAEMCKLVENSFRDVNIAFANELSLICDRLGLDVWQVIRLANRHPRVNILQPGPGVGGHCIAVDPWFVVHSAPEQARLIRTAREVNDAKSDYSFQRAADLAAQDDAPIAVLGLSFKPNIDDLRESPALAIAQRLAERFGSRVRLVEPHIEALPAKFVANGAALCDAESALDDAATVILLVDHAVFAAIDPARLTGKRVYDTRGLWPGVTG